MSPPTEEERSLATHLIRGHSVVEVHGKWKNAGDSVPSCIVLPETMTLIYFIAAPCKQEVSLMKTTRQARQASNLFKSMDLVR